MQTTEQICFLWDTSNVSSSCKPHENVAKFQQAKIHTETNVCTFDKQAVVTFCAAQLKHQQFVTVCQKPSRHQTPQPITHVFAFISFAMKSSSSIFASNIQMVQISVQLIKDARFNTSMVYYFPSSHFLGIAAVSWHNPTKLVPGL